MDIKESEFQFEHEKILSGGGDNHVEKFELRNHSQRIFNSIDCELIRRYHLWNGQVVEIELPQALCVSRSGHFIVDAEGTCMFMPYSSYAYLTWVAKAGHPHFVDIVKNRGYRGSNP